MIMPNVQHIAELIKALSPGELRYLRALLGEAPDDDTETGVREPRRPLLPSLGSAVELQEPEVEEPEWPTPS